MGNVFQKITPTTFDSAEASSSVKAQSQAISSHEIYTLVQPPTSNREDGRGILVEEAAHAFKSKDYTKLHQLIREKFKDNVYKNGHGKDIPIKKLVENRNRLRKDNATAKQNAAKFVPLLQRLPSMYNSSFFKSYTRTDETRRCCWDVDKRGALGETALHICFLNNTHIHNILAKEIINVYPNLIHDIYLGDEYYGESVLHMAIANENIDMLTFILSKREELQINIQERCYGKFFCPHDQKPTRHDLPDTEIVGVAEATNYKGLVYWGEYPLSFAACSQQYHAFRILIQEGADLFAKDSNGNNVLHMMVIHNNVEMFDYIYHHGGVNQDALLEAKNKQGLTPLTLSAKLANKSMLDHILELKREVSWVFGEVTCAHYPLSDIDTINPDDGSINNQSALSIILSKASKEHLLMLDGLLYQLLHEKWKQYAKVRFYIRGFFFLIYLAIFVAAIYLQPAPLRSTVSVGGVNTTVISTCYLQAASDAEQIARFVLECFTVIGAVLYLFLEAVQVHNEGLQTSLYTIWNAPMKGSFLISCVFILSVIPCRFTCSLEAENIILTLAICTCIPYLLFFCRGFKLVGPFIVAIYNMITGDLLRFLLIYGMFLMGFSQAMYVLFRGVGHPLFSHPFQSIMAMFVITLGEFSDLYLDFDQIQNAPAAKLLFFVYMILCTVLLINVLIAMMGNTFNTIAETRYEWQRQWAKIVLVMEQSVSPDTRRMKQMKYSLPVLNNKGRRFVIRSFREKKA